MYLILMNLTLMDLILINLIGWANSSLIFGVAWIRWLIISRLQVVTSLDWLRTSPGKHYMGSIILFFMCLIQCIHRMQLTAFIHLIVLFENCFPFKQRPFLQNHQMTSSHGTPQMMLFVMILIFRINFAGSSPQFLHIQFCASAFHGNHYPISNTIKDLT